mmetsp:Transcript_5430/g.9672  ORF Transcript_5430/g.9672 Transcript_5430/m.9672 type:complete len:137 (-) Transcript_5430:151-561(-)
MVVLEAAAIGAAGYGLYRGGEAGVRKGKEAHKEYKREQNRSVLRNELGQKTKARSERISQIMSLRRGASAPSVTSTNATTATTLGASVPSVATTTGSSNTTTVEDRHRAVMEKLRAGRNEQAKNPGKGRFNPFKKK